MIKTKKYLLLISLYIVLYSCNPQYQNPQISEQDSIIMKDTINDLNHDSIYNDEYSPIIPIDENKYDIVLKPIGDYSSIKAEIIEARNRFKSQLDDSISGLERKTVIDSAKIYLNEVILNKIIPHWYGTPWDFDGYSNIPGKGYIACGYLVSTVLKHAGFNINRFKLAQLYSLAIVKTLNLDSTTIDYGCKTVECLKDSVSKNLNDGIYVIGLDNHVGFLLYRKEEVFFIHSNYLVPSEVIIEYGTESQALNSSQLYYLGEITTNDSLIRKWIKNEVIIE